MRIIYFSIVWGIRYIKYLMDYSIPSMMSENNLPYIKGQTLYIYTDSDGQKEIRNHPRYEEISKIFTINYWIVNFETENVNKILANCTRDMVALAKGKDAVYKMVIPDGMVSSSLFKNSYAKIRQGYKATVIPTGAIRVNDDLFNGNAVKNQMTEREMIQFSLDNMHKETLCHFNDSKELIVNPVQVLYSVKNGFVSHSLYHQPGFFTLGKNGWNGKNMEYDIVGSITNNPDDIYFMSDSDEGAEFNITKRNRYVTVEVMEGKQLFDKFLADVMNGHEKTAIAKRTFETGYYAHMGEKLSLELIKKEIDHLKSYINEEVYA